jgi:hypothetical protein
LNSPTPIQQITASPPASSCAPAIVRFRTNNPSKGITMLHVVTLFTIKPDFEDAFARSLRIGGDWHRLARSIAPNLVTADLLRHQLAPLFVCIDFWTSSEAYHAACNSQAVRYLLLERRRMAASSFELGAFSFPAMRESRFDSEPCQTSQ